MASALLAFASTVLCVVHVIEKVDERRLATLGMRLEQPERRPASVTTHFDVQYVLTALGRRVMNIAIGNRREEGNPILRKTAYAVAPSVVRPCLCGDEVKGTFPSHPDIP